MGALLSYSIQSGLILLAMYITFRLFLAADNQHSFNRFIILAIYAISFLLLPVFALFSSLFAHRDGTGVGGIDILADMTATESSTPTWGRIILLIYITGMCVVAFLTVMTWFRLLRIIRKGEKHIKKSDYTLILTENPNIAPFSWMRYMVISRSDYEACGATISIHELHHIRACHWIDLLVAQAVVIINWYNPASWLMREDMMLIHEYQADMAVLSSGKNPKEYQILLIKKAVGARFPSLANSLNHSNLKKRITMMYKSKSSSGVRFKALALAPAVALALVVASVPQIQAAMSTISDSTVVADKVTKNSTKANATGEEFRVTSVSTGGDKTVITVIATIPSKSITVDGGILTSGEDAYLSEGINCNMQNDQATITFTFPKFKPSESLNLSISANGNIFHSVIDTKSISRESAAMRAALVDDDTDFMMLKSKDKTGDKAITDISQMDYFIDGKKADATALNDILPSEIASMEIDKTANAVRITLKKN